MSFPTNAYLYILYVLYELDLIESYAHWRAMCVSDGVTGSMKYEPEKMRHAR